MYHKSSSNTVPTPRTSTLVRLLAAIFAVWLTEVAAPAQAPTAQRQQGEPSTPPATRPADPNAITMRIYKVDRASAENVAKVMSAAIKADGFRCAADTRTNAIILNHPARLQDQIEELLRLLDVPPPPTTGTILRETITLPTPDKVTEVTARLLEFSKRHLGGSVKCIPYPEASTITVEAPEEAMRLVRELLNQLAPPPRNESASKVFVMRHANARNLAEVVQRASDAKIRCVADETGNQLVVTAPEAAFNRIKELIAQLDVPRGPSEPRRIISIQLESAKAEDVANTLTDMVRNVDVTLRASAPTNSLLISGSDAGIQLVKPLVAILDKPPVQPDQQIKTFQLSTSPDDRLAEALKLALGDLGEFAVDPVRKAVIAKGNQLGLEIVADVLKEYDKPSTPPVALPAEQRIRIVWLVTNLMRGEALAPEPPADMKAVVEELARIGVSNLRLAAQTVVNVADGTFEVECTPELVTPCRLTISGKLRVSPDVKERRLVELRLQAIGLPPSRRQPSPEAPKPMMPPQPSPSWVTLCNLSTTVSAPPGHNVVLGVTPIGEMTSVFVLQLLPQ